jgi:hypothetical protein
MSSVYDRVQAEGIDSIKDMNVLFSKEGLDLFDGSRGNGLTMNNAFGIIVFEHGDVQVIIMIGDQLNDQQFWLVRTIEFLKESIKFYEGLFGGAMSVSANGLTTAVEPLEFGLSFKWLRSRIFHNGKFDVVVDLLEIGEFGFSLRVLHVGEKKQGLAETG